MLRKEGCFPEREDSCPLYFPKGREFISWRWAILKEESKGLRLITSQQGVRGRISLGDSHSSILIASVFKMAMSIASSDSLLGTNEWFFGEALPKCENWGSNLVKVQHRAHRLLLTSYQRGALVGLGCCTNYLWQKASWIGLVVPSWPKQVGIGSSRMCTELGENQSLM